MSSEPAFIKGLAPVARRDARVLILGSMPGHASLTAQRYYAHPANSFWRLIAAILDVPVPESYLQRLRMLRQKQIAMWDVVHSCQRVGSLDSAIDMRSIQLNPMIAFLRRHREIRWVFFNGATAEKLFQRHLRSDVLMQIPALSLHRLPSSSPANAGWSFERKLDAWRIIATTLACNACASETERPARSSPPIRRVRSV